MIGKQTFKSLIQAINKEIKESKLSVQSFAKRQFFNTVFLNCENALGLYGKIKNSNSVKKFESTYNACLVLSKYNDSFVLRINY